MGKLNNPTKKKRGKVDFHGILQSFRLAPIRSQNRLTLRGQVSRMVGLTLGYPVHPGRLTWNIQTTHFERKMI